MWVSFSNNQTLPALQPACLYQWGHSSWWEDPLAGGRFLPHDLFLPLPEDALLPGGFPPAYQSHCIEGWMAPPCPCKICLHISWPPYITAQLTKGQQSPTLPGCRNHQLIKSMTAIKIHQTSDLHLLPSCLTSNGFGLLAFHLFLSELF